MPSHWLELSIKAGTEIQDPIANFVVERGSTGLIHTDQTMRAFFPSTASDAALKRTVGVYLRRLRVNFPDCSLGRSRWRLMAEKDWHSAWRKYFRPQKIRGFTVTPPWIPVDENGCHVVVIEPAMAFGTGTHETTRCCLEFLDEFASSVNTPPQMALDVGTGSGILAIALAKVGVPQVLALDNDPIALEAAEANLRLNGVVDAVTLSSTSLGRLRRRFPLVVANIILETLVELAGPLTRSVRAGGTLILSGLLRTQVESVLGYFPVFTLEQRKDRKEWSTLLLRKVS